MSIDCLNLLDLCQRSVTIIDLIQSMVGEPADRQLRSDFTEVTVKLRALKINELPSP